MGRIRPCHLIKALFVKHKQYKLWEFWRRAGLVSGLPMRAAVNRRVTIMATSCVLSGSFIWHSLRSFTYLVTRVVFIIWVLMHGACQVAENPEQKGREATHWTAEKDGEKRAFVYYIFSNQTSNKTEQLEEKIPLRDSHNRAIGPTGWKPITIIINHRYIKTA